MAQARGALGIQSGVGGPREGRGSWEGQPDSGSLNPHLGLPDHPCSPGTSPVPQHFPGPSGLLRELVSIFPDIVTSVSFVKLPAGKVLQDVVSKGLKGHDRNFHLTSGLCA